MSKYTCTHIYTHSNIYIYIYIYIYKESEGERYSDDIFNDVCDK